MPTCLTMNFLGISFLLTLLCTWQGVSAQSSSNRTVVFLHYVSKPSESVFIRGGKSATLTGCSGTFEGDPCNIAIHTRSIGTTAAYDPYNSWRVNENYLDWHGAEPTQGMYGTAPALGTPLAWTTNNVLDQNYQELNRFGDNYWMVDMEMDCSNSESGWFELKAFITSTGWEADVFQSSCTGDVGGTAPFGSINHVGMCGFINTFDFKAGSCIIDAFPN